MKCPHCNTGIKLVEEFDKTYQVQSGNSMGKGFNITIGVCPECSNPISTVKEGECRYVDDGLELITVEAEYIVFPMKILAITSLKVPQEYRDAFNEAYSVRSVSPKSSAALCRRLLQELFWNEYKIRKRNLNDEIEEFVTNSGITLDLVRGIDAIRTIGNFAAHPIKYTNTGCIVDVEPGEVEFCLSVLKRLMEITFIQPAKTKEFEDHLNKKLQDLGKTNLKS